MREKRDRQRYFRSEVGRTPESPNKLWFSVGRSVPIRTFFAGTADFVSERFPPPPRVTFTLTFGGPGWYGRTKRSLRIRPLPLTVLRSSRPPPPSSTLSHLVFEQLRVPSATPIQNVLTAPWSAIPMVTIWEPKRGHKSTLHRPPTSMVIFIPYDLAKLSVTGGLSSQESPGGRRETVGMF